MNNSEELKDKQEKFVTQDDLVRIFAGIQGQPLEEEEDIDWMKYVKLLWKGKKMIIITTFLFSVLGVAVALMSTRTYTASITLAPELGKGSSSGSLGGIASMLGMGGLSMGSNGADAYNVTTYPDIVASTPFLTSLFDIRVVDPKNEIDTTLVGYLTRKKGFSISEALGFGKDENAEKKEKDIMDIDNFSLTKKQAAVVKKISKSISCDVDKKTGITTIQVTTDNAYVSAVVADSVCSKLCRFIYEYRTQKSRENLDYYQKLADESYEKYAQLMQEYADYQDRSHGLIIRSEMAEGTRIQNELNIATQIYTQMKQQAELAKGKVQEEKPVFAVIEPASVPLIPSKSRAKTAIIYCFLGFVLSCAWVCFGEKAIDFIKQMKEEVKEN